MDRDHRQQGPVMAMSPTLLTADAAFIADPALLAAAAALVAAAHAGNWYAAATYPDSGQVRITPAPVGPARPQLWVRLESASAAGVRRCWLVRQPQGAPPPAEDAPEWISAPAPLTAAAERLLGPLVSRELQLLQSRLAPDTYRVDVLGDAAPLTAQFRASEVSS